MQRLSIFTLVLFSGVFLPFLSLQALSTDYRLITAISSTPTSLSVIKVFPRSVTVQWSEVVGATSYLVEVSTETGQQIIIEQDLSTTQATFRYHIKPNRAYQVKVKAVNNDDVGGEFSESVTFRTPPAQLKNVTLRQWDGINAVVRWPSARGVVASYTIKVSLNGKTIQHFSVKPSGKKNTEATISNLVAGKTYSIVVRTKHNNKFVGKYSKPITVTPEPLQVLE